MTTLLVVGDDQVASTCAVPNGRYTVEGVATLESALGRLARLHAAIVITELVLQDGDGAALCTAARSQTASILVLAITSDPARVPRAIAAGCHSVLLKPFARNLLFARLGRLNRELQPATSTATAGGTNELWPDVHCPQCARAGVTSFEASGLNRLWYACTSCEHAWLGRRPHRPTARRLHGID